MHNFRGSSLLTDEQISQQQNKESLGPLILQGVMREKAGVLKEHQQMQIYRDQDGNPRNGSDFDENEFIPIQSQSVTAGNSAAKKESIKEPKALTSILNNPVYKKSPFYPFADEVRRK